MGLHYLRVQLPDPLSPEGTICAFVLLPGQMTAMSSPKPIFTVSIFPVIQSPTTVSSRTYPLDRDREAYLCVMNPPVSAECKAWLWNLWAELQLSHNTDTSFLEPIWNDLCVGPRTLPLWPSCCPLLDTQTFTRASACVSSCSLHTQASLSPSRGPQDLCSGFLLLTF